MPYEIHSNNILIFVVLLTHIYILIYIVCSITYHCTHHNALSSVYYLIIIYSGARYRNIRDFQEPLLHDGIRTKWKHISGLHDSSASEAVLHDEETGFVEVTQTGGLFRCVVSCRCKLFTKYLLSNFSKLYEYHYCLIEWYNNLF